MPKNHWFKLQIATDYISALASWSIFYLFRKRYIEGQTQFGLGDFFGDEKFMLALLFVPFFWLLLYALWGNYVNVLRRSRLKEFLQFVAIAIRIPTQSVLGASCDRHARGCRTALLRSK